MNQTVLIVDDDRMILESLTAMQAVNTGGVFRSYTKPCPSRVLACALEEAVEASVRRGLGDASSTRGADDAHQMTQREMKVAEMVRKGMSTKEIASELNLSPRTVETYRDNIRNKLGLLGRKVNLHGSLSSRGDT